MKTKGGQLAVVRGRGPGGRRRPVVAIAPGFPGNSFLLGKFQGIPEEFLEEYGIP